jgi:dihydrofolate reductase
VPEVVLVAAVAANGVIGRDGGIPWHLPEDLHRFRQLTIGHPVVMGRRTWESLPERFRPLPGRRNIVVSRSVGTPGDGAEWVRSLDEALARTRDEARVGVIGGAALYAAALPRADRLELTEIDRAIEGDTVFPAWDRDTFVETAREEHVSDDGLPFAFVTYLRRA